MSSSGRHVPLVKLHGLGNDFLVAFHPGEFLDGYRPADLESGGDGGAEPCADRALGALAMAVCDRHRGVGADGLLIAESDEHTSARMVLYNADGSRAEMSGNGVRCLAHALYLRRGDSGAVSMTFRTDAGLRRVDLQPTDESTTMSATVDMGEVTEIAEPSGWASVGADPGRPVAHLSLGNPHAVVPVDDVTAVDLAAIGSKVPDVNVEIVQAGPHPNAITMRVHERGAGITEACGTGACAAAVAARRWGLADLEAGKLMVHMDGGTASVLFGTDEEPATPPRVSLSGPTTYIATIDAATQ